MEGCLSALKGKIGHSKICEFKKIVISRRNSSHKLMKKKVGGMTKCNSFFIFQFRDWIHTRVEGEEKKKRGVCLVHASLLSHMASKTRLCNEHKSTIMLTLATSFILSSNRSLTSCSVAASASAAVLAQAAASREPPVAGNKWLSPDKRISASWASWSAAARCVARCTVCWVRARSLVAMDVR